MDGSTGNSLDSDAFLLDNLVGQTPREGDDGALGRGVVEQLLSSASATSP